MVDLAELIGCEVVILNPSLVFRALFHLNSEKLLIFTSRVGRRFKFALHSYFW